ncbi:GNAT family N-acetyltransferase [Candidatus Pacearchaeota archaeon]|nr:GNAT family N-acetyltransferase [Candidatus Pacearchaeota archaeon]
MDSYTLSRVSRRTSAGGIVLDPAFLQAQTFLFNCFPARAQAIYSALSSRNTQLWTYKNGSLVGAAITSHPTAEEGELHFIGIAPELQSRGLGRFFYTALEAQAFSDRRKIIAVTATPAFFESLGFFDRSPPGQKKTERYMLKAL